eukprot:scaffold9740_cov129-Isochrysis_galbana.AAC.1
MKHETLSIFTRRRLWPALRALYFSLAHYNARLIYAHNARITHNTPRPPAQPRDAHPRPPHPLTPSTGPKFAARHSSARRSAPCGRTPSARWFTACRDYTVRTWHVMPRCAVRCTLHLSGLQSLTKPSPIAMTSSHSQGLCCDWTRRLVLVSCLV